jgi:hypothetical protein
MLLLLLFLSLVEPGVAMWRPAHSVLQNEDDRRGVQLLRRAQGAMGGAGKLASVRDTIHAMEITLEPAYMPRDPFNPSRPSIVCDQTK